MPRIFRSRTFFVFALLWIAAFVGCDQMEKETNEETAVAIVQPAETGEPVFRLRGHSDSIRSVAWFHDRSHLVTGSADGTIRIWQIP